MKFMNLLFWCSLLSTSAFSAIDYNIILMWIFKDKNYTEKYVFPTQYENINIENDIKEWVKKNPNAPVIFFFDSKKVSDKQITNTQALFDAINHELSRARHSKLALMDIHTLPLVRKEPEIFSSKIPRGFITDLIEIEGALYFLQKCGEDTCYNVYADLSVEPMSEAQLFDIPTLTKLNKFGIVFAKGPEAFGLGPFNVEHIFHIIGNNKPNLITALQDIVVNPNIERAKNALNNKLNTAVRPQTDALENLIYESLPRLFEYFYFLEGLGKLVNSAGEKFNPVTHTLLDTTHDNAKWQNSWKFEATDPSIWDSTSESIKVPTKRVKSSRIRSVTTPTDQESPVLPLPQ